jgi:hypothetical protein
MPLAEAWRCWQVLPFARWDACWSGALAAGGIEGLALLDLDHGLPDHRTANSIEV